MKNGGIVNCLEAMIEMANKYGARKVTAPDGQVFHSVKEFHRWGVLKLLERAGKISDLKRQVKYELIPAQTEIVETGERYKRNLPDLGIRAGDPKTKTVCLEQSVDYVADFVYIQDGKKVVEDSKGYRTDDYIIKRKLMLWVHGIRIKET